jgi:hypothetical protein
MILSYKEFKAQMNVFLKNRKQTLKNLIKGGASSLERLSRRAVSET